MHSAICELRMMAYKHQLTIFRDVPGQRCCYLLVVQQYSAVVTQNAFKKSVINRNLSFDLKPLRNHTRNNNYPNCHNGFKIKHASC